MKMAVRALGVCLLSVLSLSATALAQSVRTSPSAIPDHVVYWELFHRVAAYAHKADAAQRQGKDRSNLKQLVRRRAGLDEEHGQMLEQIALQCEHAVLATDAKARAIIDRFHVEHPYRLVNKNSPPPSPPSELRTLSRQRVDAILLGRDRLHSALGDEAFAKFDRDQQAHAQRTTKPVATVDVGNVPGHTRHVTTR
jgi:hypothetical protein